MDTESEYLDLGIREHFYKIMKRQNVQWELIDKHLAEDEDIPVKPVIKKKNKKESKNIKWK